MLAFIILLAQGRQEDYEMIDPPMMTDYDDDLDEEVIMQKGLESYFVTQFGEGDMDGSSWEQAMDAAGFPQTVERFCRPFQEHYLYEPGQICDVRRERAWRDYPQECESG